MKWPRKLLFPFSVLYGGVVYLRNKCYDWGWKTSRQFDFPVIVVGNLSTGGTGKSPMIEYLIQLLKEDYYVASLSRGYKRKTKGFHRLTGKESAEVAGDEPLQFKSKFPEVIVAVDENRVHGIEQLRQGNPKPEVVLLDDAYQHRRVNPGLSILLTPYADLYSDDFILPVGNLRENKAGARRSDLIVVTKCPAEINQQIKDRIKNRLNLKAHQQLFFSQIEYSQKVQFNMGKKKLTELGPFTLVTGIANPKPLYNYLKNLGLSFKHIAYSDHHRFTRSEIKTLAREKLILTTEKDFMRLKKERSTKDKVCYLPISVKIDRDTEFNSIIKKITANYPKNLVNTTFNT